MKSQLKIYLSLLFIALAGHSIEAQLNAGLVSYYPFSGDANDQQANANPSSINGATLTSDRWGRNDRAYFFKGAYIDTHTSFDFPNRSISLWFKADSVNGTGFSSRGILFMDGDLLEHGPIRCHIIDGTLSLKMAGDPLYTEYPVEAHQWYHLVMIKDGNQTSYFVNGEYIGSGTFLNDVSTSNPYPYAVIGTDRHRDRRWFEGTIDDIRFYNRVLTTEEIAELFQLSPDIDSDWLFVEGSTDLDPIYHRGNVAIGLTDPGPYKLAVNGLTRTLELEVVPEGWSDYVFDDQYPLMALDSLRTFIREKHHLPGIPTEEEALQGIRLAEFSKNLLAKIEELTLYILQQDAQIKDQARQIKILSEKIME